jgi:hypothetical protein
MLRFMATRGLSQETDGRIAMKRIAALAAVIIGLLAIPAAAMASTGSSGDYGPGYGTTMPAQPYTCYYGFHRVHHRYLRYFDWWKHGRWYQAPVCPFPRRVPVPQPKPQPCLSSQTLTFSVAAGSSAMTEVSGPQLSPAEEFVYDGNTYTVMSVNPGAGQFTAFVNNVLFTNNGAAITDAAGAMVCGSS